MDAPILRFDRYNPPESQSLWPGLAVWLEINRGRVRHAIRPVRTPAFLIGAAPDCDLVVGDAAFPEAYACLLVQQGSVTIRRIGAEPELLVNGEAIATAELASGDRLAFGPFELTVRMHFTPPMDHQPQSDRPTAYLPWLANLTDA